MQITRQDFLDYIKLIDPPEEDEDEDQEEKEKQDKKNEAAVDLGATMKTKKDIEQEEIDPME
jgi:hypothetical protein